MTLEFRQQLCSKFTKIQDKHVKKYEECLWVGYDPKLIIVACEEGRLDDVKTCVEAGRYLDEGGIEEMLNGEGSDSDGSCWAPICVAAFKGYKDIVLYLINEGADVNRICPREGCTVLHAAAFNGHYDIVKLLLKVMDKQTIHLKELICGNTALDENYENNKHDKIIQLMREYGIKSKKDVNE